MMESIKLLICGPQGAGKTCLHRSLVERNPNPTNIDAKVAPNCSVDGGHTLVMDSSCELPGDINVFTAKVLVADVILVTWDVRQPFEAVSSHLMKLRDLQVHAIKKPVILVGSKLDLAVADRDWILDRASLSAALQDYSFIQGALFTSSVSLVDDPMYSPMQLILSHASLHAHVPVHQFYDRGSGKLTDSCLRALVSIHRCLDEDRDGFVSLEVLKDLLFDGPGDDSASDIFSMMDIYTNSSQGFTAEAFLDIFISLLDRYLFASVLCVLEHFHFEYAEGKLVREMQPGYFEGAIMESQLGDTLSVQVVSFLEYTYRSWANFPSGSREGVLTKEDIVHLTGLPSLRDSPRVVHDFIRDDGEPRSVVLVLSSCAEDREKMSMAMWMEYWELLMAALPRSTLFSLLWDMGCPISPRYMIVSPLEYPALSPSLQPPLASALLLNCTGESACKALEFVPSISRLDPENSAKDAGITSTTTTLRYVHCRHGSANSRAALSHGHDAEEKKCAIKTLLLVADNEAGDASDILSSSSYRLEVVILLCDHRQLSSTAQSVTSEALPGLHDSVPRVVLVNAKECDMEVQLKGLWYRCMQRARLPSPIFLPSGSEASGGNGDDAELEELLLAADAAVRRHPHHGVGYGQGRRLLFKSVVSVVWSYIMGTFKPVVFIPLSMFAGTFFDRLPPFSLHARHHN